MTLRFFVFLGILLLTMGLMALVDSRPDYVLVIHGGAGAIRRDDMTPELEARYHQALQEALEAGEQVLREGGSAEDAVIAAIVLMEDNPLFNAGKGAVLTSAGTAELDASLMSGRTGMAGAVAGVKTVKNPILAARLVMDSSEHVLLTGAGAETFAHSHGLEKVKNTYFYTRDRMQQLQDIKALEKQQQPLPKEKKHGTVGAVALDRQGNLAAGTSTGGMMNKRFGRVGDAPLIGAGTYADNATCAVSCTGHGEYFIRNVVAYDVSARMKYSGKPVYEAAEAIIHEHLPPLGGTGGLIAVDKHGNIALPFNTAGMYRGYVKAGERPQTAIYAD